MKVRSFGSMLYSMAVTYLITAAIFMHGGFASAAEAWDAYVTFPLATVPNVQGVIRIIDGIKQQSNGALTIRLHLGGSLPISTTNITQAVADTANIIPLLPRPGIPCPNASRPTNAFTCPPSADCPFH